MTRPDLVALWDLHQDQWVEWIAAGLGEIDYDTYRARLESAVETVTALGHKAVLVRTSVAEVLARLEAEGWEQSPATVAAVIALLAAEQTRQG